MKDQILFILKGGEVSRYHTIRTLQEETVAAHSFGVAWFVYMLRPSSCATLIMAALAHDLAEQYTGDLPAPSKRELGIGRQFGEFEDRLLRAQGLSFELDAEQSRILKLADCLQGMLFCIRDRSLGNRGVDIVCQRYQDYIQERLSGEPREQDVFNAMKQLWLEAIDGKL